MTQHIPELPDSSLIEFINCYVESPMTDQELQLEIDNGLSLKKSRRIAFWLGLAFVAVVAAWCASASAQAVRSATITFTAPTLHDDGTAITGALSYEIWQGLKGGTKTKVSTITSSATTISTGLLGGNEYCWHVIAVEAGNMVKSVPSNEACKAFQQSAPSTVTITVT